MFESFIADQFAQIQSKLTRIEGAVTIMANTQADLDAAITQVQAAVTQLGTDLNNAITSLQGKITSGVGGGVNPADFSAEVASLTAIANSLSALDATAVAANSGTTGTTGTTAAPGTPVAAGASKIIATPASVNLTGTAGSTANFAVLNAANPSASFNAVSSNTQVATVAPGTAAGQFVVTRVAAGAATIKVSDTATPPNAVSVSVTAS